MVSFMYITDGVWHCSLPFHVKRSPPSPKRRQPAWFPTPSRSRRTERNISSPVWPTETRRTWCCLGSGRMLYLDRYKLKQSMPTFRTYMLCGIHLFKWEICNFSNQNFLYSVSKCLIYYQVSHFVAILMYMHQFWLTANDS